MSSNFSWGGKATSEATVTESPEFTTADLQLLLVAYANLAQKLENGQRKEDFDENGATMKISTRLVKHFLDSSYRSKPATGLETFIRGQSPQAIKHVFLAFDPTLQQGKHYAVFLKALDVHISAIRHTAELLQTLREKVG